jgi:NAD-dependent SIR2 family protein deacetylase
MDFSEFLRIFEVRASNLNWFLGAGCSIAAGIPSAYDIIWDCKSRIYCSENSVSRSSVSDISNPAIQQVIQDYLETKGLYPKSEEDGDDYTYYFEKAISSPSDRQAYIQQLMNNALPSYGHLVLAALAKLSKAPIVWTTNFDKLYENSIFKVFDTTNELVVADLGEPDKATKAIDARSFPLLVKLHGDFHSERLKNTGKELRHQDEKMRTALFKACTTNGLCMIGYSGRDNSVMDVLKKSAEDSANFPHGIFWFNRAGTTPLANVTELIDIASSNDIEAYIIEINNFDETLDQIRRYIGPFPEVIERILKSKESRLTESPIVDPVKKPPYLRINAVKVDTYPATCKLIESDIDGGYKLIQKAIEKSNANIIARRIRKGIIAFGQDQEIKKAFNEYNIKKIQVYGIEQEKLTYFSEESKLIFDAFCQAITRNTKLTLETRRDEKYLIADKTAVEVNIFNSLVDTAVSEIEGIVPKTNIKWVEACKIKLDYKFNRYWIVLSPQILLNFNEDHTENERTSAKSFIRERTAPRWTKGSKIPVGYNQVMGSILAGWISIIKNRSNTDTISLPVLGIDNSADPIFEVSFSTIISGRVG